MSEKFQRLYRGISDSGIVQSKLASEHAYAFEMERRQTLDSLGYKVGYTGDNKMQKNRHHGKLARKRNQMRERLLHDDKEAELAVWEKVYQNKLLQINNYHSLACELQTALLRSSTVPNTILKKFVIPAIIIDEREGAKGATGKTKRTPQRDALSAYVTTNINQLEMCKSASREKVPIAKYKWSDCEKKKMNDLYSEIVRPASNNPGAWSAYHEIFVGRFSESFPSHTAKEVTRKLLRMLSCRQLKMQGEEEYWRCMARQSLHQHKENSSSSISTLPAIKHSVIKMLPEMT